MKILMVTSEVKPFSETGGLGDVLGSLPKYLKKLELDVKVVSPLYADTSNKYKDKMKKLCSINIDFGEKIEIAEIYSIKEEKVEYLFIKNDEYYGREQLYGYEDDYKRFAFFSKVALHMLTEINFKVDIIHCNDWQSSLVPIYLKDKYKRQKFYKEIKTVLTIHNLQYQGVFDKKVLKEIDLDDSYCSVDKMEFYGQVNFLKGGLIYCNKITTVSRKYSKEIQEKEYGFGLDGVMRHLENKVTGIINGIDYVATNPKTEKELYNFDKSDLKNKYVGQKELRKKLGLEDKGLPLVGMATRLVSQKGLDILPMDIKNIGIQLVVLGTGDKLYENKIRDMEKINKGLVKAVLKYDNEIAKSILAYSDMFLMPSLFEPCGLGQIYALRYGTVPIVRNTGGLSDTVDNYNSDNRNGSGIVFDDFLESGVVWALKRSVEIYNKKENLKELIENGMNKDYSWNSSAEKYKNLYLELKK